ANVGSSYLAVGDYANAEVHLRTAIFEAQRMGLVPAACAALGNLPIALLRQGRNEEALASARTAIEYGHTLNDDRIQDATRVHCAIVLLETGDPDGAHRESVVAAELLRRAPPLLPFALAVAGQALLAKGEVGDAVATARAALDALDGGGEAEDG